MQFSDMRVAELRAEITSRGISYRGLKKAEMVKLLEEQASGPAAAAAVIPAPPTVPPPTAPPTAPPPGASRESRSKSKTPSFMRRLFNAFLTMPAAILILLRANDVFWFHAVLAEAVGPPPLMAATGLVLGMLAWWAASLHNPSSALATGVALFAVVKQAADTVAVPKLPFVSVSTSSVTPHSTRPMVESKMLCSAHGRHCGGTAPR